MAKFEGYPIASASYSYVTTFYRALAAGAGYAVGDIIRQVAQVNNATGALTGISNWYNVDQDANLAAAPPPADIEALDNNRVVLGSAQLTVSNVAAGVGFATPPAQANYAEVHVWNADISLTLDGSAPTTGGNGYRQANGQTFELESAAEIAGMKAIRLGATDALLYVTYFRVYGRQLD